MIATYSQHVAGQRMLRHDANSFATAYHINTTATTVCLIAGDNDT